MSKKLILASILSFAVALPAFAQVGVNVGVNTSINASATSSAAKDKGKASTSAGSSVSAEANVKVNGDEVRGMSEEDKIEFMQTVKTHAQLQSNQDLDNFAKGVLLKDENVASVDTDDDGVEVDYKVPAKFVGLFSTNVNILSSITFASTSPDRVKVRLPWYRFLFKLDDDVDTSSLESEIKSQLNLSAESSLKTKYAKSGLYIQIMTNVMGKLSTDN